MSGTTSTVLALAGGTFFIALLMPIFFDVEFPAGDGATFVEKAICTIIPNGGGNYTCVQEEDIVYYNGTGITITANDTLRTVFFEVTNNGTITTCTNIGPGEGICSGPVFSSLEFKTVVAGSGINITSDANSVTIEAVSLSAGENTTAVSLGGDADVYKTEIGDQLQFRGITGGAGITVTERTGDVLINSTGSGEVDFAVLTAGSANRQQADTPNRLTTSGTNMDILVLDYDPSTSENVIWHWQLPDGFDAGQDVDVTIRFTTVTGSVGGICWDGSFLGRTAGEPFDAAFGTVIGGCDTTLDTAGDLNEVTLSFTPAQHGLAASDSIFFNLARDVADASDTHGNDARFIDAVVKWSV